MEQHIAWLNQLFSAYGLPAQGKTAPVTTVKTPDILLKALKNGKKMEEELAGHYAWLLRQAGIRLRKWC